ncbi:hypothetical protein GQ600_11565 [Phytophthora cactorum]|nr:hypothetical protein GQ600_11565 [Phytophthora cactorum]
MLCDGQCGDRWKHDVRVTASSQEDLMTGFSYKNAPKDCVEKDRDGKRYGYLVLHSVDLPQCRPFEARGVTRAKMYFTCLFREITPGYLNLVAAATKSFMIGLLNGVGIGLAKKLTLMARRNKDSLRNSKQSECSICFKTKKKLLFGLNTHLSQCGVCGATTCSNCIATTKQILFLGLDAPARNDLLLELYAGRSSYVWNSSRRTGISIDESLDTDPFSREVDEADFCFSDEESNSSIVAEPDPSPVMSSDSDKSTLTLWTGTHRLHTDDFIPATRKVPTRSEFEVLQTLFQLNVKAENTYIQTKLQRGGKINELSVCEKE